MLEEATPEDREQKQSQRKRQSQIAEKEHRGEELGRRRAEDLRDADSAEQSDRRVKTQKEHSQQQAVRSIANSRREEHTQQQGKIKKKKRKSIANSRQSRASPTAGEKSTEDLQEDGKDSMSGTVKESVAKKQGRDDAEKRNEGYDKAEGRTDIDTQTFPR